MRKFARIPFARPDFIGPLVSLVAMSENAIIVVELSLSATEAPVGIAVAKRLLLDAGIIAPNDRRDALRQPSEYRAGPRAIEVAPWLGLGLGLGSGSRAVPCAEVSMSALRRWLPA